MHARAYAHPFIVLDPVSTQKPLSHECGFSKWLAHPDPIGLNPVSSHVDTFAQWSWSSKDTHTHTHTHTHASSLFLIQLVHRNPYPMSVGPVSAKAHPYVIGKYTDTLIPLVCIQ